MFAVLSCWVAIRISPAGAPGNTNAFSSHRILAVLTTPITGLASRLWFWGPCSLPERPSWRDLSPVVVLFLRRSGDQDLLWTHVMAALMSAGIIRFLRTRDRRLLTATLAVGLPMAAVADSPLRRRAAATKAVRLEPHRRDVTTPSVRRVQGMRLLGLPACCGILVRAPIRLDRACSYLSCLIGVVLGSMVTISPRLESVTTTASGSWSGRNTCVAIRAGNAVGARESPRLRPACSVLLPSPSPGWWFFKWAIG